MRLHESCHVRMAFSLGEMLIDGHAGEERQTSFVALTAHVGIVDRTAAAAVVALDGRPRRAAGYDAAAADHVVHQLQGAGPLVSIDEAPLPAAAEPDSLRLAQSVQVFGALDIGELAAGQHLDVLGAETGEEAGIARKLGQTTVRRLVIAIGWVMAVALFIKK